MTKSNPYLEKSSSIIASAAATHLAQNIATNQALKNKSVAKYLANSFSQGAHGVVDTSKKSRAIRGVSAALTPDISAAHTTAHRAGQAMSEVLGRASKRQKVGIRMITEGRFDDLVKHNLHKDPIVQEAHSQIRKHMPGIPDLAQVEKHKDRLSNLRKLWKDKSHPILSNVMSNISRGSKPVGDQFKSGRLTQKDTIAGSLAAAIAEPVAGGIDAAKTLMVSKTVTGTKVGKAVADFGHNTFVKSPVKKGLSGVVPTGVKHEAYKFAVNPVSAHLKRTTAALKSAVE